MTTGSIQKFLIISTFIILSNSSIYAVGLYEVFEKSVTNTNTYSNKFTDITLHTQFKSPSNKTYNFRGFHDGNGAGNQTGNVWKFRFMPNEIGIWRYTYTWSDSTAGGDGSFSVKKSLLKGPLKVAKDNSWFFSYANNRPFHARPYDLHHVGPDGYKSNPKFPPCSSWADAYSAHQTVINSHVIPAGYNLCMLDAPSNPKHLGGKSWWYTNIADVFDITVFKEYERIIELCAVNGIYIFPFDGFVDQKQTSKLTTGLIDYITARFGAYYNFMGYSPTYEYTECFTPTKIDSIMETVKSKLPLPTLLSAHDYSPASFSDWLGFSMRQEDDSTLFIPNSRTAGRHGGVCLPNLPIIGSEDIWEGAKYENPQTPTQVRRAGWGGMMAGIIPLYSEWHKFAKDPGAMPGEAEFKRMLDFFYTNTTYRTYQQLNNLVSSEAGQICSGNPGNEYLVYDQNGGTITIDLSGASSSQLYTIKWYNPTNDSSQTSLNISGGISHTLTAPYDEAVLLLKAARDSASSKPASSSRNNRSDSFGFSSQR